VILFVLYLNYHELKIKNQANSTLRSQSQQKLKQAGLKVILFVLFLNYYELKIKSEPIEASIPYKCRK
jgi:hypothetical protein